MTEHRSHITESEVLELKELQRIIGYEFRDVRLLVRALKHRSYVHSLSQAESESNERLEFLGDAVLNLVVSEHLYRRFGDKREGELSQIKSILVSRAVIGNRATRMGLERFLFLSNPQLLSNVKARISIIGDAFEALIGAIYLDGGLKAARQFLMDQLLKEDLSLILNHDHLNFKGILLEFCQADGRNTPVYVVRHEAGPDHWKVFTVEVKVQGENLGLGKGKSKKEAEQSAAKEALKRLGCEVASIALIEKKGE
ncbi:MAG TPA: ribonuclease III [Candidatus Latescibacteria bacterium]|nr:ribonuclease III [Candidatus Latescibacterota bacterium]